MTVYSTGFQNGVVVANNIDLSGANKSAPRMIADGQLIIGKTGGNPQIATLTAGTGLSIVNGAGTITLNATGGGLTWQNIGASQALVNNYGYVCGSGAGLSFSLPATASVGYVIQLALNGATSWTVTQGAGQQIRLGNVQTTSGVGGYLASTAQGDWIELICDVANTHWIGCVKEGNITVA